MENEVWEKVAQLEKDCTVSESAAGRAVIKDIIGPDAGADRKTETGRKTYGRVQGSIKKHSRS